MMHLPAFFPTTKLLPFFSASLLLGIAPGPDIIFVLTQSALHGTRAGIATTLGLLTGLCAHTAAVAAGVAAMLRASPTAFTLLKCVGAAYLLYLALLALRATPTQTPGGNPPRPALAALYQRGIVMNITNPKVTLFFLAFLPQFCEPDRGYVSLQILLLGGIFMLATLFVFTCAAIFGGWLATWLNTSPRSQILLHRFSAAVFAGLAVTLVFT